MATWTGTGAGEGLSDDALEPNKPWTSAKALALRDNTIALAEGAIGAPKVEDAALDVGNVTTTGTDWVLERVAGASSGVLGTYALLSTDGSSSTESGSNLFFADASGGRGSSPSGTWQLMGSFSNSSNETATSLWLRIA